MDLKAIAKFADDKQKDAPLHERLIDIYSGNLNQYVRASIAEELTPASFKIAEKRIPSINLLERITKKLSKVYTDVPRRTIEDTKEQVILDLYIKSTEVQSSMAQGETLLNLNHNFCVEPYLDGPEGKKVIKTRVLSANEFCVYSDDTVNPKNPTAIIKFMGSYEKLVQLGTTAETYKYKTTNIYWVYTNMLLVKIDGDGDLMGETIEHNLGMIPIVYCTADKFRLQPKPDTDAFDNTLLAPKLLCDLNFATQFQSHSIMYGIDVNINKNVVGSPDAFLSMKSDSDNPNAKPVLGILSPSVDTEKVIALIEFTISQWLESKGIKPGSAGNTGSSSATSAVSKIVDEADTTQVVSSNRIILLKAEKELWALIAKIHNTYAGQGKMEIDTGLSESFDVSVSFPVQQIITDPQEQRDNLKFQLENKLISYKRALKLAHPDLSEDEIVALMKEIQEESAEAVAKAQEDMNKNKDLTDEEGKEPAEPLAE